MTFNEDGTLTGCAVPPSSKPALGSPEYGLWKREHGNGNYSFTDLSYSYDEDGAFAGSVELSAKIQLGASGATLTHQLESTFSTPTALFSFLPAAWRVGRGFARRAGTTGERRHASAVPCIGIGNRVRNKSQRFLAAPTCDARAR
jgi:hypothetical protein